jgi:hypothetical protein
LKNGAKNKIVCFGEEITGTEVTNLRTVLSLSLGGYMFRDDDDYNNL